MTLSTPTPWMDDYDSYDEPDVPAEPRIEVRYDLEQGSEEWLEARRGMLTASVIGQLITVGPPDALTVACPYCHAAEGGPCLSAARKEPTPTKVPHPARIARAAEMPPTYKPATGDVPRMLTALLVAERINGWSDPVFISSDMWRGKMEEPLARSLYSETYAKVTEAGLIVRSDWGFSIGYSPDGLVGDDGLIEVKSRRAKRQLLTVLDDTVPLENLAQIQTGLLVSGRSWCDYVSYSGGMPMWRTRVYPDPAWQAVIVEAARLFERTATRMLTTWTERTVGLPATERTTYDLEIV
jgi:hypothetical protein